MATSSSCVYHFSIDAYCKLLLHAVKYPHRSVCGILIGERSNDSPANRVSISDVLPLFHNFVGMTAMLEVAFAQAEAYCRLKNKFIAGFYQANEVYTNNSLSAFATAVGQKMLDNLSETCLVVVLNSELNASLQSDEASPLPLALHVTSGPASWKQAPSSRLSAENGASEALLQAIQAGLEDKLVDFDNYLDCPQLDYFNSDLLFQTKKISGGSSSSPHSSSLVSSSPPRQSSATAKKAQ